MSEVRDFYGCCGASTLYVGRGTTAAVAKRDVTKVIASLKGVKSLLFAILPEGGQYNSNLYNQPEYNMTQIQIHEPVLLELGFVKVIGPVKSVASNKNLTAYVLNLNEYFAKELANLQASNLIPTTIQKAS